MIAVIGAGSWGTALAIQLASNGHQVKLWGHVPEHMMTMQDCRQNTHFLPDIPFPETLIPQVKLADTLSDTDFVLIVVPSHAFRSVLKQLKPTLGNQNLAWASKGFEPESAMLLSEIAQQELGSERPLSVISGPTFAGEVARRLPTAITVAGTDATAAQQWANLLQSESFRAYTSNDIIGVQVGGAAKNVLAIAAGIADGLGFGANSRAALITRGLAEIKRLGTALGAHQDTFSGLAGLGDLALTCTDNQSRNRRMGLALAKGLSMSEARESIGQEVEGINTAKEIHTLTKKHQLDMPICHATWSVLFNDVSAKDAVHRLLTRHPGSEY